MSVCLSVCESVCEIQGYWAAYAAKKQAVAELGQTQVIEEIVVEVRSGNCRWSLSSTTCPGGWWWVGGWSD